MSRPAGWSWLVAVALILTSCGGSDAEGSGSSTPSGEIRVAAAASLTEAFTELGQAFEAANPDVEVVFDFGPSSGLSDSILEGAPADVFASADETNMTKLVDGEAVAVDAPVVFARNRPEMVVPAGNPGGVTGLADLADPDLLVGLCAEEVPCGKFARTVLEGAGVTASIDTNEPDVKALLAKVTSADLDVGIVYHTDVVASGGEVEGIEIPEDQNVIAQYPVAALTDAPNADGAAAFAAFVASADARSVLDGYGFLLP